MDTHDSGLVATLPRGKNHERKSRHRLIPASEHSPALPARRTEVVDGDTTNWHTVTGYRQLARNVFASVNKGDSVIVVGALRLREWLTDTIGHHQ